MLLYLLQLLFSFLIFFCEMGLASKSPSFVLCVYVCVRPRARLILYCTELHNEPAARGYGVLTPKRYMLVQLNTNGTFPDVLFVIAFSVIAGCSHK